MSLTRAELKILGEKNNWQCEPLTLRDVQRMGSDCLDFHRHFNRLNLQAALTPENPAVPSPASMDARAQRDLALKVLGRYPSYVWSERNGHVIDAYLRTLVNPRFTEQEVRDAFESSVCAGKLELRLPSGRIVVGNEFDASHRR